MHQQYVKINDVVFVAKNEWKRQQFKFRSDMSNIAKGYAVFYEIQSGFETCWSLMLRFFSGISSVCTPCKSIIPYKYSVPPVQYIELRYSLADQRQEEGDAIISKEMVTQIFDIMACQGIITGNHLIGMLQMLLTQHRNNHNSPPFNNVVESGEDSVFTPKASSSNRKKSKRRHAATSSHPLQIDLNGQKSVGKTWCRRTGALVENVSFGVVIHI